jgi:hypothetical protein
MALKAAACFNGITMRFITLFGFVGLFTLLGCSSEPSRYSIHGTVKIAGTPAGFTSLKFFPTGPGADPTFGGVATCDSSGKFEIGSDGKNTGLPAGKYKVVFTQTLINGRPALGGSGGKKSERQANETDGAPVAYRDVGTTPEEVTISGSSKTFDFDLKKK